MLRGGGREVVRAALHLPRLPLRRGHRLSGRAARRVTGRVVHSDTPRSGWFECSERDRQPALAQHPLGPARQLPRRARPTARSATSGSAGSATPRSSCPPRRSTWTSPRSSPSGATTSLDAQSPDGAYPDVAPRLVARARRRAGVGRRRGHRAVDDLAALRRPAPRSSATGTRWSATWTTSQRHNPDLLWTARRGNDYGDWLSVGARHAARRARHRLLGLRRAADGRDRRACSGGPTRAEHYERLRAGIVAAFNARLRRRRTPHRGRHADRLPARAALGPAARGAARRAPPSGWSTNIERHDWHLTTGFVGVGAAVPGAERARATATSPTGCCATRPSRPGATRSATARPRSGSAGTAGPRTRGFQTPMMNSFNHYSLGSVGQWLYEHVAGIRAAAPGYEHVLIAPEPGGLEWARADLPLGARADHERVAPGRRRAPSSRSRSRPTSPRPCRARRRDRRGRLRPASLQRGARPGVGESVGCGRRCQRPSSWVVRAARRARRRACRRAAARPRRGRGGRRQDGARRALPRAPSRAAGAARGGRARRASHRVRARRRSWSATPNAMWSPGSPAARHIAFGVADQLRAGRLLARPWGSPARRRSWSATPNAM